MTVKLRIEGTPEEIQTALDWLKSSGAKVLLNRLMPAMEPEQSWQHCSLTLPAAEEENNTMKDRRSRRAKWAAFAGEAYIKAEQSKRHGDRQAAAYYEGYAKAMEYVENEE